MKSSTIEIEHKWTKWKENMLFHVGSDSSNLFEDEKKEYYIQKEQDEFESFKARRLRFANSYNKKFKGDD